MIFDNRTLAKSISETHAHDHLHETSQIAQAKPTSAAETSAKSHGAVVRVESPTSTLTADYGGNTKIYDYNFKLKLN